MWGVLIALLWPLVRWLAALPFLYFILSLFVNHVQPAINFLLRGMTDLSGQMSSNMGGQGADYGIAIELLNFLAIPQAIGLAISAMSFCFLFRVIVLSARSITKALPKTIK